MITVAGPKGRGQLYGGGAGKTGPRNTDDLKGVIARHFRYRQSTTLKPRNAGRNRREEDAVMGRGATATRA